MGYDATDIRMVMKHVPAGTGCDLLAIKCCIDEMTMKTISYKIRSKNEYGQKSLSGDSLIDFNVTSSVEIIDGPFTKDDDSEDSDANLDLGVPLSPSARLSSCHSESGSSPLSSCHSASGSGSE